MDTNGLNKLIIPESELKARFTPSGGPGGQHANRSNTRVELIWVVTESKILDKTEQEKVIQKFGTVIRVVVDETRSQTRNREIAKGRLQARVASSLRSPKKRVATRPSRSAKARRLSSKKRRGHLKQLRQPPRADEN